MKILYIGEKIITPTNGSEVVEFRNQSLLEEITNGNVLYVVPDLENRSFTSKITVGLTSKVKNQIDKYLINNDVNLAFVSMSFFGAFTRYIASSYSIPVITFFHNAEILFFKSELKKNFSIRGFLYFCKIVYNEKHAVKYSSKIITLNDRDSETIYKYYGRKADFILPTTFDDKFKDIQKSVPLDIDYLFVGSSFFANIEGIQWFLDNVMPKLSGQLYIVGRGMDKVSFNNLTEKVIIKGLVNDLSEYYNRAKMIISPIFSGSGMKTKTAEALMYGKDIIGTSEAFEGYIVNLDCMHLCNNAEDFVVTIKKLEENLTYSINNSARNHFKENYNNRIFVERLKTFLKNTCTE